MTRRRTRPARSGEAGVTLVEVLVSLAIFAVIGVAGYAMLDLVLRSARLTEGRLAQLGQMERAMYLVGVDFAQAEGGSLLADGMMVSIHRRARDLGGGDITVGYGLAGTVLTRRLSDGQGAVLADQALLPGVTALGWQFLDSGPGWSGVWSGVWPAPGQVALLDGKVDNPRAVELTLTLTDGRILRRVAVLPGAVP